MNASAVGPADDPLSMELLVHLMRRRQIDLQPLRPGGAVGVEALAPTFRARAMSGGEGDGLVMEVQKGEVMRLPLLMPAAAELERARDPQVAGVKADDLPAGMDDAAVSGPGAAERDGHDVTRRRDSIARGCHAFARLWGHRLGSASWG